MKFKDYACDLYVTEGFCFGKTSMGTWPRVRFKRMWSLPLVPTSWPRLRGVRTARPYESELVDLVRALLMRARTRSVRIGLRWCHTIQYNTTITITSIIASTDTTPSEQLFKATTRSPAPMLLRVPLHGWREREPQLPRPPPRMPMNADCTGMKWCLLVRTEVEMPLATSQTI